MAVVTVQLIFTRGNLSFLLQALLPNQLTIPMVDFLGYFFFIFEASETIFFKNQKQKLVIIQIFEN